MRLSKHVTPLGRGFHSSEPSIVEEAVLYNGRTASLSLHVVIVGCGLGGLAAGYALAKSGHRVTILEGASAIGEIGAGIQVTPNLSRILIQWGLGEKLKELCVVPEAICLRRWSDGDIVGWTPFGEGMEKEYGAPYYHIHRADLHQLLYDLAAPHLEIRVNSLVTEVDPVAPSATLSNGLVVKGDLIIGADGVKSTVRDVVVGKPDRPVATGDAAYRAIVNTEDMLRDPLLRPLVEKPEMTGWMGPGRHLMAYNIRARKEYNLVMAHPDTGSIESWTAEGSAQKWRDECKGWDPRVAKLLDLVSFTLDWKLMDRLPLDGWIHPAGKVTLLGDACHPMLPYRAQGSAMAVEDAVVLGNLFSRLSNWGQVFPLLQAYEALRLPRTSETQRQSRLNQKIFHYPDGPEQQARDASMRAATEDARREARGETVEMHTGNANQWADKQKSIEQFRYDAAAVVEKWWSTQGQAILNISGAKQRM